MAKIDWIWSLFNQKVDSKSKKLNKRSKRWLQCLLKERNSQLNDQKVNLYWKSWFISKKSIYIKKVDQILSLLIYFQSLFVIIWTQFNQFCRHNCFGFQQFGSKMLIKWWFESNFSQNLALGWFNCLSLIVLKKWEPFKRRVWVVVLTLSKVCKKKNLILFLFNQCLLSLSSKIQ